MDLKVYIDQFLASGSLIVGAILAVGSQLGRVGIQGKAQAVVCVGAGLVLGTAYNLATMGVPASIQGWSFFVLTTLIIALMPTGLYEMWKTANLKSTKQANDELLQQLRMKNDQ